LLHDIWASRCWLPHLSLTGISRLPHLTIEDILTVTLLRTRSHWVISSNLLSHILKLLTLAHILILLASKSLSSSTLTLSGSRISSLFVSTLNYLSIVSFEKVLASLLWWSSCFCRRIIKLIVLFLNTSISYLSFCLFSSLWSNQIWICISKTCFWKIRSVLCTSSLWTQLCLISCSWNILSLIADNFPRSNVIIILDVNIVINIVWHVLWLVVFVSLSGVFTWIHRGILIRMASLLCIWNLSRLCWAKNYLLSCIIAVQSGNTAWSGIILVSLLLNLHSYYVMSIIGMSS